ncbi:hypothetical protein FISHEDRAFT_23961, partial [Fistulina hepatica ATCC 64428]
LNIVHFQVENQLFKVPKIHLIEDSVVFRDMFLSAGDGMQDGENDDHPIALDGILASDFEALLGLLYESKEIWMGMLRMAKLWEMSRVRCLAIDTLSKHHKLSPSENILLAREFSHTAWLREGYRNFVTASDPPTLEDAMTLSPETVIRLLLARE